MNCFTPRTNAQTIPLTLVASKSFKAWKGKQTQRVRRWLESHGTQGKPGETIAMPGKDGAIGRFFVFIEENPDPWSFATIRERVPKGRYSLEGDRATEFANIAALGWGLASYRFSLYKKVDRKQKVLVWPKGCDRKHVGRIIEGVCLARELINTAAGDLGPQELAEFTAGLAEKHGAECSRIVGEELLKANYPAVHAVGRAASRPPCLIDLRWGDEDAPKVTLVGKGVVFDSGGLDLKTASGMRLMKKDMGGAAAVIGLAHMIMDSGLPVRLRVLIPAVENAVSGDAFRPGDVLQSRKGTTIEVGNTDAEGRLILCDALTEAASESPELLMDFATLTGAARVALGTELPALFANDDELANELLSAGADTHDPMWRMPLYAPYRRHLDSRVADISNVSSVPQGGAITAALFLQHFVPSSTKWTHVDTMGWNSGSRPGRPQGGEGFAIRAFFEMLSRRYGSKAS